MGINKIYFCIFSLFLSISTYTTLDKPTNFNNLFSINKRLNFDAYTFVYLNQKTLKEGYFTFPIEDMAKKPRMLIYETYMNTYQKLNLEKAFFKVADLYLPHNPSKQSIHKKNDFVKLLQQKSYF